MRKFTEILAISIFIFALSIPTYLYYCEFFWGKYFEYETTLPENTLYAFDVVDNDKNLQITLNNYQEFTWKREMATVDHANWHLHYIAFQSDSVISISGRSEYLENYYYSFPIFRTLFFNKEKPTESRSELFDGDKMEIVYIADGSYFMHEKGEEFKRIKVRLIDQKLVVYWAWL